MTFTHKSIVALLVLLTQLIVVDTSVAQRTFRGVQRLQTNEHGPNINESSEALARDEPFFIDLEDTFKRTGGLAGTRVDRRIHELVPPFEGVALGPLTGAAKNSVGVYRDDSNDYVVRDGKVQRLSGIGSAVTSLPWRVTPTLGDDYLLEISVVVADGETASVGYLADPDLFPNSGMNSDYSELMMSVTRNGDNFDWTVAWDMDDDARQSFSSVLSVPNGTADEEIRLQLGWQDVRDSQNDLFDAWLETSAGNTRLLAGNMSTAIDVHAIGLELDGPGSYVTNFRASVPEPNASALALLGFVALLSLRSRRK